MLALPKMSLHCVATKAEVQVYCQTILGQSFLPEPFVLAPLLHQRSELVFFKHRSECSCNLDFVILKYLNVDALSKGRIKGLARKAKSQCMAEVDDSLGRVTHSL